MERRHVSVLPSRHVTETVAAQLLQIDHQKARRIANAANEHTVKWTALLPCLGGALDGMNPGSCGYMRPLPGAEPPIWMYPPGGGGQLETPG